MVTYKTQSYKFWRLELYGKLRFAEGKIVIQSPDAGLVPQTYIQQLGALLINDSVVRASTALWINMVANQEICTRCRGMSRCFIDLNF